MNANYLIIDADNYARGEIIDIEETDEVKCEQFAFTIRTEGSLKPIIQRFWTSKIVNNEIIVNSEITVYGKNGQKFSDYNSLDRAGLNFGLITEKDLASPRTITVNLDDC